ncbi:hypothetical protein YYC_02346 [Plasmodium yoelii 17X]|uniref:Fam-a protein n=1 Tax=Plasmodium yoelii 17X TaxID=1323249 RepID=V7PPR5_PLAYE|nr:hypothetical protein YYC_02346 [Plasmodium yoelii 17X]
MNKFYIQIILFLLIISLYVNNETLATETAPKKDKKSKSKKDKKPKSKKYYPTSEELYEKNKHLLCTNHEETIKVGEFVNKAAIHLEHHAKSKDGYKFVGDNLHYYMFFFKKKHQGHTIVKKVEYIIYNSNKYNKIVNMLWGPDCNNFLYKFPVKRKIARVYNPNLVMIQQRYKSRRFGCQKYFYALAANFEISENKTMIVMASPNINDHNSKSKKPFENTIIEDANLLKIDIDSEKDIKQGKLKKTFANLIGYIIEKHDGHVDIIYIESVSDIQILIT